MNYCRRPGRRPLKPRSCRYPRVRRPAHVRPPRLPRAAARVEPGGVPAVALAHEARNLGVVELIEPRLGLKKVKLRSERIFTLLDRFSSVLGRNEVFNVVFTNSWRGQLR